MNTKNKSTKAIISKYNLLRYKAKWLLRKIRGRAWFAMFTLGLTKNKPYQVCYLVTSGSDQFDGLMDVSAKSKEEAQSKVSILFKKRHDGCLVEFYACEEDQFFYGLKREAKQEFDPGSSAEAFARNLQAK